MGAANTGGNTGGSGNSKSEMKKKAEKDTQVSAYEAEINKQKAKEKAQKTKTTFSKENDTREGARSTNYTTQPKTSTFKTSKKSFDDAAGKSKLDNYQVSKNTGSLVLNSFQKARQKMFETNRKFFQEKVLTSKNRGNYEDTFDSYSSYIDSRMSGKTDAYGNTIYSNSNNDNPINKVTKTAPTEAEVSQATTTEADADTEANRLLKIKKKGRSQSIISGSQGVTKMAADYSLGKKSLLGRV